MRLSRLLDRTAELQRLNRAWALARRGQAQLIVLWGRRRVGKTFLLSHFVRGKRAVFFGATQQAEPVELARLAEAVRRDLGDREADLAGGAFNSWEAALRFFAALAATKPLIVVLDEVPYLTRSTPGFPGIVQAVWDHLPPRTKLQVILTGSAVSTVEAMMSGHGPLRGRPTDTLRLDPLDPWSARLFLPRLDPGAFLEAYAACGGLFGPRAHSGRSGPRSAPAHSVSMGEPSRTSVRGPGSSPCPASRGGRRAPGRSGHRSVVGCDGRAL